MSTPIANETLATGMVRPKTTALFFDKLWVHPALIRGFAPYDELEQYRVPPRFCITEPMGIADYYDSWLTQRVHSQWGNSEYSLAERLQRLTAESWDIGTIFAVESIAHFEGSDTPQWRNFRQEVEAALASHGGGLVQDDSEFRLSTSQRNRAIAFVVQLYAAKGIAITPIYLAPQDYEQVSLHESAGLEICLDQIPAPVESKLEWEQVDELRKDRRAVDRLQRFRRWFTLELSKKSATEISVILEERLDDYSHSLRTHGIETALGATTSVLTFAAGPTALGLLAASPLAAAAGGIAVGAGAIAWIGRKWIERSYIKRDDVAYIYDVRRLAGQV